MKKIFFVFLFIFPYSSQAGETFPPDHWANEFVQRLISQGYLSSISFSSRPYERQEVASALFSTDKSTISNQMVMDLFSKLETELQTELNELQQNFYPAAKMRIGADVWGILEKRNTLPLPFQAPTQEDVMPINFKFRGRVNVSFSFLKEFTVLTSAIIGQPNLLDVVSSYNLYNTSTVAYIERAFLSYKNDYLQIKLGRDYIDWGVGKNNFSISYYSGLQNHLSLKLTTLPFTFNYILAQLPSNNYSTPVTPITMKYLSASQFSFHFAILSTDIRFNVWQMAIQNASDLNWWFINPVTIYKLQPNTDNKINTILGGDLHLSYSGFNLYGSFAWHSFVINNGQTQNDIEPNRWAAMIGAKATDILRFAKIMGTDVWFEIGRVPNRTFQSLYPSTLSNNTYSNPSFLAEKSPIGHPYGTDFDFIEFELSHYFFSYLKIYFNTTLIAKGEGSMLTNYTTPWLNASLYPISKGYSENSPSGIVEYQNAFSVGAYFQYWSFLRGDLNFTYLYRTNANHINGAIANDFQIRLSISLNFYTFLTLISEK